MLPFAPARGRAMTTVRFSPAHAADDGRLARAAQQGDQSAFGELYGRYARMIHGLLLARVPTVDVDDTDEV